MAGLLNDITGGATDQATADQQAALMALQGVQTPTQQQLSLPDLQKYAAAMQMTPAQMQAFLQQTNALNNPIAQTGTDAQQTAIGQLANVANAGAMGTPQEQAQIAQALQQSNQNLQGQRGAIDQAAESRGVAPGMLQAALGQVQSGQDQQAANQAALQAQAQAYQAALGAMTSGANAGQALQGQQNTQANTVGAAQNAMQQFNAANQQNAAAANAGYQQAANQLNTNNANTVAQANTGLKNQQTLYNAQVPETVYQNQLGKAQAVAGQGNQMAGTATAQGQQAAGLTSGLLGTAGTVIGGIYGGPMGAAAGKAAGTMIGGGNSTPNQGTVNANPGNYGISQQSGVQYGQPIQAAKGGIINPIPAHYDCAQCMARGGITMKQGGMIPGKAKVAGDSTKNDTVPIKVSPGEAVVPRTTVQQNPGAIQQLLSQNKPQMSPQGMPQHGQVQLPPADHNPKDIAALLAAMKHLRGSH